MRLKNIVATGMSIALAANVAGCGNKMTSDTGSSGIDFGTTSQAMDVESAPSGSTGSVIGNAEVQDTTIYEANRNEIDPEDSQLTSIITGVKSTLKLNTDEYAYFRAEENTDPLETKYYLYWTATDGKSLTVLVNGSGLILKYVKSDGSDSSTYKNSNNLPSFPEGDAAEALLAGENFAQQCLGENETLIMGSEPLAETLGAESYRFHGNILLNDLPAGIGCNLTIRASDYEVLSFSRTDWEGMVRDADPVESVAVEQSEVRELFLPTIKMEVEYVLPTDESKQAYLVYEPVYGDTYYVDAKTGDLVDLTLLAESIDAPITLSSDDYTSDSYATNSVSELDSEDSVSSLTEVELAGSARLDDTLDQDGLDEAARKYEMLGLSKYSLTSVSYNVSDISAENAEDTVTATLVYVRTDSGNTWRRTVCLDARSGELISLYSSMYAESKEIASALRAVSQSEAQSNAEAFLASVCGEDFSHCVLDSISSPDNSTRLQHQVEYIQEENGYPYRGNGFTVSVDATDGSISRYDNWFDEDVTFESPEGMISEEEAVNAWMDTYQVMLRYVQVPFAIDATQPEYDALADTGIDYMYQLVPGYSMERDESVLYIRARDAYPVQPDWAENSGYMYDDVDESDEMGAKILKLARYGVGITGGSFSPKEPLTKEVLDELLTGIENSGVHYWTEDLSGDNNKAEGQVLTRGEAVADMVYSIFPAEICEWSQIYSPQFSDKSSIPEELIGPAALAGASGMLDTSEPFNANGSITRGDAAVMLYGFLSR